MIKLHSISVREAIRRAHYTPFAGSSASNRSRACWWIFQWVSRWVCGWGRRWDPRRIHRWVRRWVHQWCFCVGYPTIGRHRDQVHSTSAESLSYRWLHFIEFEFKFRLHSVGRERTCRIGVCNDVASFRHHCRQPSPVAFLSGSRACESQVSCWTRRIVSSPPHDTHTAIHLLEWFVYWLTRFAYWVGKSLGYLRIMLCKSACRLKL